MKRGFLILVALLIGFYGISSPKKKVKSPKINGLYELVSLKDGKNLKRNMISSTEIQFIDKHHEMLIYVGCNRINGEWKTSSKSKIEAKVISSTRMACSETTENLFKSNLEKVNQYRFNGDQLHLMNGEIVLIILQRKNMSNPSSAVVAAASFAKPQGTYQLEKLWNGKELKKGNYEKAKITIEHGKIGATVGCNGIGGEFQTDGKKIVPLKLMMTEKYCDNYDQLERQFVNVLNEVDAYEININLLELYSKGKLVMVCSED